MWQRICGGGGRQNIGGAQDVIIASGSADISPYATITFFNIRGEGAAADDLETLVSTGSTNGDIVYLTAANETITVKNLTGNIICDGDRVLNYAGDTLTLRFTGADWIEIGFASP